MPARPFQRQVSQSLEKVGINRYLPVPARKVISDSGRTLVEDCEQWGMCVPWQHARLKKTWSILILFVDREAGQTSNTPSRKRTEKRLPKFGTKAVHMDINPKRNVMSGSQMRGPKYLPLTSQARSASYMYPYGSVSTAPNGRKLEEDVSAERAR